MPRPLLALWSLLPLLLACAAPSPTAARSPGVADSAAPKTSAASPVVLRDCPPPPDLGVRWVGRHDGCDPGGVRQGWSGSGFVARFAGTGIALRTRGPALEYTVVVDERPLDKVVSEAGSSTVSLASGLEAGEHTVEVYRRGEASFGAATLEQLEVTGGELLPPPAPRARAIELVGDSITCGYGNEGTSKECHFSAATENHFLTYGAVLGRTFGADVSTVAWSGKGVVVNYAGEPGPTLPDLYDAAVPTDGPSRWNGGAEPGIVIVNLGTNDYSTDVDPADDRFVTEYAALLARIRARYPRAHVVGTNGPMLSGADLATVRQNIRAAVALRQRAGDERVVVHDLMTANPDPGCDWHPSVATHAAMAEELARVVRPLVGW